MHWPAVAAPAVLDGGTVEVLAGFVSLALLVVLVGVIVFSLLSLINTLVEITMYLVVAGVIIGALFFFVDPLSIDKAAEFFHYVMRMLGGG